MTNLSSAAALAARASASPTPPPTSTSTPASSAPPTTPPPRTPVSDDATLHLPRLLCLHGGGTNARIFSAQCRVLRTALSSTFRLVFADAPFECAAAAGIGAVYDSATYGPFRRWLRWLPEHDPIAPDDAVSLIDDALGRAMAADEGDGEWAGLVGFSQGAKLAASLLLRQQVRGDMAECFGCGTGGWRGLGASFRFAVLMAGRAPVVSLEPDVCWNASLVDAAHVGPLTADSDGRRDHVLKLPTVHVHGLRDEGLELHRVMLRKYCEPGSARLVEWDGNHRVPIRKDDIARLVDGIFDVARESGVLKE